MRPGLAPILFGRPGWVLPGASVDMDFKNGRYWLGSGTQLSSLLSITRASNGTDLLPSSASGDPYTTFDSGQLRITGGRGLLIEEARTNVLLNSTAPVTQTTASLATGTYTLWFNGSGSATSSAGTATITGGGAATNGTPNVFVVTVAGTVTITVAGVLNAFQCELGAFGTSLIVTAGASATRAADVITLIGPALTAALNAKSAFFQTSGGAGTLPRLLQFDGGGFIYFPSTTQVSVQNPTPNAATATIGGSGTVSGLIKSAYGFNVSSMTAIANNGTKATDVHAWAGNTGSSYLGGVTSGNRQLNGYMQRFAFSLTKDAFDNATA